MQKKLGYGMLALAAWAALVVGIHLAEKSSVALPAFHGTTAVLLLVVAAGLYFLPGIIASRRGASSTTGIVLLNILLGWTVLGWIASLIWAVSGETTVAARSRQVDYRRLAVALRSPAPPPPPAA